MVDKERLVELAERLKATVHLARTYASGTGSIFETAMLEAERLADRTLLEPKHQQARAQSASPKTREITSGDTNG